MRLFQRAYHFLKRITRGWKEFPLNFKNFGLKIALVIYFDGLVPPGKSQKYISTIESYVADYIKPLVNKYKEEDYTPDEKMVVAFDKVPIWCCWWQGKENMPEIVKMCNERLSQVIPENAELHMITMDNYKDYVDLPDHILSRFHEGKMSMTALSDVLRVALLSKFGGFWIDSTVFPSKDIPNEFISWPFFSQKMYDPQKWIHEACKGRWCGFMMAGSQNNIIFRFLRDAFYQWWKDFDCVIDYVILDYFLLAAYKNIPVVKQMIDAVPDNNIDVFEMYKVLHYTYSAELMNDLNENTVMHKLTYKIDLFKNGKEGEKTLYSHLLESVEKGVEP